MSSKPKQQNYKPSAADKANASVAMAEYQFFKQYYDPLLQQMRDKSMSEDFSETLRGRANADTMQAISPSGYRSTQISDLPSDLNMATQGQLQQASAAGKKIQNTMQTNVVGTASGQKADAQTGMGIASRLGTSEALSRAKANQIEDAAKLGAGAQLLTSVALQGYDNMQTTGQLMAADGMGPPQQVSGGFFTPVNRQGQPIQGFKNRFKYAVGA
jgi:hypothetical protein